MNKIQALKSRGFFRLAAIVIFALPIMFSCKKTTTMKLGFSGKDLTKETAIVRDKETKSVSLEIKNPTNWKLYAGNTVESIDLTKPVLEGKEAGVFPVDVPTNIRTYFQLVTDEGTALLAERHLPMKGGYNFRDLGGFRTQDGRYTKWGKIFRSDDLNHLSDDDLNYLSSIPLTTIVDFRSEEEISKAPDKNPASLKNNYQLKIDPGSVLSFAEIADKSDAEMEQIMMELNEILVTEDTCVAQYREFLSLLQSDNDVPLMFHCSAGKDRTGIGAALILSALGVDRETIIADYLASNQYLGDKYAPLKAEHPALTALFEVRQKYIEAGLAKIETEYGSIDAFLTDVLKVDIEAMKSKFLY